MPSEFTKKFQKLGACKEGIDWCEAQNVHDFKTAFRTCPAPEFMCWSLVRIMGMDAAKAPVECVAAIAQAYDHPLLKPALALCREVMDGKSSDIKKLQIFAYDLSSEGLTTRKGNGACLISLAYACYCVAYCAMAKAAATPEERTKKLLKAAQHASDAASHAWTALPKGGPALPQVVREAVREDAAIKAWGAVQA